METIHSDSMYIYMHVLQCIAELIQRTGSEVLPHLRKCAQMQRAHNKQGNANQTVLEDYKKE